MQSAAKGNLNNAVLAVVDHYILIRILIEFLQDDYGKEYVREILDIYK